jgi:hypothetical protein
LRCYFTFALEPFGLPLTDGRSFRLSGSEVGKDREHAAVVVRGRLERQPASRHRRFSRLLRVAGDGTVGVTYYDWRNDVLGDGPLTTDVWFAHSHDGGASWAEVHLAGPFDFRSAPFRKIPGGGRFVGDYHGLAGLPHGFAAAFAMAAPQATSGATDIFFAQFTLT